MSGIPRNGRPVEPAGPPPVVAPSPVPFTVQADLVMAAGRPMVQLRIFHAAGVTVVFMDPDAAKQVANAILDKAGGLVVAGNG